MLSWHDHVNHICNSLVKYFGIFNGIKNFVSKKIARQLYFAFVYSRIKYGIEVYGKCADNLINKIQTIQNKLLKLLLRADLRTPTIVLHNDVHILKVKDIFITNLLAFVNNCLMGHCPEHFKHYFNFRQVGNPNVLKIKGTRLILASGGCYVQGTILWNALDYSLHNVRQKMCFKTHLVKYLIRQYL